MDVPIYRGSLQEEVSMFKVASVNINTNFLRGRLVMSIKLSHFLKSVPCLGSKTPSVMDFGPDLQYYTWVLSCSSIFQFN